MFKTKKMTKEEAQIIRLMDLYEITPLDHSKKVDMKKLNKELVEIQINNNIIKTQKDFLALCKKRKSNKEEYILAFKNRKYDKRWNYEY